MLLGVRPSVFVVFVEAHNVELRAKGVVVVVKSQNIVSSKEEVELKRHDQLVKHQSPIAPGLGTTRTRSGKVEVRGRS